MAVEPVNITQTSLCCSYAISALPVDVMQNASSALLIMFISCCHGNSNYNMHFRSAKSPSDHDSMIEWDNLKKVHLLGDTSICTNSYICYPVNALSGSIIALSSFRYSTTPSYTILVVNFSSWLM